MQLYICYLFKYMPCAIILFELWGYNMKKLLVVVDYQNDFVDGALGFEGAADIEEKIVGYIDYFERNGDFIAFTLDTHERDYLQTTEGQNLPVEHCIKGTDGWKLTERLQDYAKKYPKFEKHTFGSLDLGNYIRGIAPLVNEVYLVGLVSNICVISNAIIAKAALDKNGKVFVIKNATDSNDKEMQQKAFEVLENLHIKVI